MGDPGSFLFQKLNHEGVLDAQTYSILGLVRARSAWVAAEVGTFGLGPVFAVVPFRRLDTSSSTRRFLTGLTCGYASRVMRPDPPGTRLRRPLWSTGTGRSDSGATCGYVVECTLSVLLKCGNSEAI